LLSEKENRKRGKEGGREGERIGTSLKMPSIIRPMLKKVKSTKTLTTVTAARCLTSANRK
jgi:hypothetical protein